jgi:hypothetical protein
VQAVGTLKSFDPGESKLNQQLTMITIICKNHQLLAVPNIQALTTLKEVLSHLVCNFQFLLFTLLDYYLNPLLLGRLPSRLYSMYREYRNR